MVRSFYDKTDNTLTLWLEGKTKQDRSLLKRFRDAFAAEINEQFQSDNWNIVPLLETGAELADFYDKAVKEAADETV